MTGEYPDGKEFVNRGIYLEVVKNERIVFTDAYIQAWETSEKAFVTAILTFEDLDDKIKYTGRVLHWSVAGRQSHEEMGGHQVWWQTTDRLVALVCSL